MKEKNMSYTNEQQQWLANMQRKREIAKLQHLQQKYSVMPDYSTMSLQDELQTRFDIDEMNQLRQKYGVQQTLVQPMAEQAHLPQDNTTQPLSDMDLVNRVYEYIKANEGFKDYPYYDTKWNQTVGAGINVSNRKRFNAMNWRDINNPAQKATQEEIDACWNKLQKEKERLQSESSTPQKNNYQAEHFESFCDIRVPEDDMKKVYDNHLLNDLPNIRCKIPNFDSLDPRIQNVIMDRMYNMGASNFAKQTDFLKYASDNDLQGLLQEVETSPIASHRKDWVRKHLK